jgi:hypothetical protein
VASSNTDCRAASICESEGRCTAERESCVAKDDRDCARTELCKKHGRCVARFSRCSVPTKVIKQASKGLAAPAAEP